MNQRTRITVSLITCSLVFWIYLGFCGYRERGNEVEKYQDSLYNANQEIKVLSDKNDELKIQLKKDEEKLSKCPVWVPMDVTVTFYTVSADECGNDLGITSSGIHATVGRTVASNYLTAGTKIKFEDNIYTVEDSGDLDNDVIDVLVATKEEAFRRGAYRTTIYILEEGE